MTTYGSGYQAQRRLSPAAAGAVIAVHLGLGAALLTLSTVPISRLPEVVIWARNIPKDATPPPVDQPPPKHRTHPEQHAQTTTQPEQTVDRSIDNGFTLPPPAFDPGGVVDLGNSKGTDIVIDPPKPPVMVGAHIDSRYRDGFQPPYPPALLRLQKEGTVTVRVAIDPEGRVSDVTLVQTADPAFFAATREQALRHWRFVPATRDGVPVASEQVLTVHFRLID